MCNDAIIRCVLTISGVLYSTEDGINNLFISRLRAVVNKPEEKDSGPRLLTE